jgi:hypothetical protein
LAEGKVVRYHVGRGSLMRKIPYLKTTEDLEILCECLRRSEQSSGQIPKTMLEPSDEKSPYGYYLTLFGPNAIDGFGFIQVTSSNGGTFKPLDPEADAIFRRTVANKLAARAQRHVDNASGWFFIKFLWDNNTPQVLHVDHRVPTEDSVIKATRDGNWLRMVLELLDQSWGESTPSAV